MPMPLFPQRPPQRPQAPRSPITPGGSAKSNLLSQFQKDDGKLDFDKLTGTGKQVMDLYSQVSPMITKFIKR